MSNESKALPKNREMVYRMLGGIFSNCAVLNPDMIDLNIELACDGGMPEEDRTINKELADYLTDNICWIYLGLLADPKLRSILVEMITTEVGIYTDNRQDVVDGIRKLMQEGCEPLSGDSYVLDLSRQNDEGFRKFSKAVAESLKKITHLDESVLGLEASLSDKDKIQIGFCVTNFMYLIKAFSQNLKMTSIVKNIIAEAEKKLHGQMC